MGSGDPLQLLASSLATRRFRSQVFEVLEVCEGELHIPCKVWPSACSHRGLDQGCPSLLALTQPAAEVDVWAWRASVGIVSLTVLAAWQFCKTRCDMQGAAGLGGSLWSLQAHDA